MPVNEIIHLSTIEELHEFLSPVGKKKKFFTAEEQFLFRGEESNQYRLKPSLFRGDTIQSLFEPYLGQPKAFGSPVKGALSQ